MNSGANSNSNYNIYPNLTNNFFHRIKTGSNSLSERDLCFLYFRMPGF